MDGRAVESRETLSASTHIIICSPKSDLQLLSNPLCLTGRAFFSPVQPKSAIRAKGQVEKSPRLDG
jgi:hypothetical protein